MDNNFASYVFINLLVKINIYSFRSDHQRCAMKKVFPENFAKCKRKHPCIKRESDRGVFLPSLQNTSFINEHVLAKPMTNVSPNPLVNLLTKQSVKFLAKPLGSMSFI